MQAQVEAVGGAQGEEEGGGGGEGGQKEEGELPQVGKIRKYGRNEKPSFFHHKYRESRSKEGREGKQGRSNGGGGGGKKKAPTWRLPPIPSLEKVKCLMDYGY